MRTLERELDWLQHPGSWGLEVVDARWVVLAVGLILVIFGSRTYKLLLVAPGLVAGVLLAIEYAPVGDPMTKTGIAIGAGIAGAVLMLMVEKIALSSVGAAVLGGLTMAIGPQFVKEVPWYAATIAGLVGAMIFPAIYRRSLRIVTPILGALAVGFALERPEDLILLGTLSLVGIVLQHTLTGKAP
jgi:hypothetical protein